ncbi:3-hydroxyacyl-CoA dehydrogenase NAD-binding domain-containing protein [Aquibacillus sp. 3ASR75-11]|uniref:3-hydroxyacyl-CoA dehydrogenase NAD-binding domain-containing protein n=1 Tax=Terrihalobacillus insolitus TaxID=2950438 RepID=A0A9X3WRL2_9BACI|nr:3-hydroxyacyl-CoA dehydrogenase NAD-binding domain-containing protein [Terrihalobacillus insolitus]MDC3415163.1 3-hydroxyacyl-CoA dehydrogenase NAD-binding domain-containing protein [Terrihalobacillus insolitus]MDC3424065.1 3-hydroxyacyl-CoA dehydrogenase NAD-binding domain-containing protein [Terrihalobacillus insolitus]
MQIKQIGVIGSGTMGSGIAQLLVQSDFATIMYDINEDILEKAKNSIFKRLDRLKEKERLTPDQWSKSKANLTLSSQIKDLQDCDLIIEVVPEKLELKKNIFKEVERICQQDAILATNTSSLSVTEIASSLNHSESVVGMHFFNPAPLMPLIEIIKGIKTAPEVIDQVMNFAKQLHKSPVLCEDTPGFIVNRVARPFYNEAIRIMKDQIASPEQIDTIMKKAGNFKMGPFELQDMIGIDVNFSSTKSVYQGFFGESRFRPNSYQERMVQAGILGRKTNKGFYDYE